jgi:hypothetical protein
MIEYRRPTATSAEIDPKLKTKLGAPEGFQEK